MNESSQKNRKYLNCLWCLGSNLRDCYTETLSLVFLNYCFPRRVSRDCLIDTAFKWLQSITDAHYFFSVNYLDLAPQYASIIVGVGNTLATLPGILIPSLTGLIVQNRVASEWRIVFYITSSVYAFGVFFYTFFGSGETQPWANKVTLPSEPIHGDEDL